MELTLTVGTALAVVQKSTPPMQREGVVAAVKRSALAIRFAGPVSWNETDEIVLIVSVAANRYRATARYVASQGAVYAFALTTAWQPLNLRSTPRYRVDLYAKVCSVLGQSRQDGRVVDLSLGGMAVWVPSKPGGGAIEVMITAGGFTSHLPCEVLAARPQTSGVIIRARFGELDQVQRAFVRQLVATAASAGLTSQAEAIRDAQQLAS